MSYTKKFDFRRQLKGMTLEELKSFREKHVNYMLDFIGLDDKESAKHSRYVGYIDTAIEKKLLNRGLGLTNSDIADITGNSVDSVISYSTK